MHFFCNVTSSISCLQSRIGKTSYNNCFSSFQSLKSANKIIIFVSHNLENMLFCNNIYFLDKGEIKDSGTFDKLIKKNNLFKKFKPKLIK